MNPPILTVDKPLSPKGRFGRLSFAAWTCLSTLIFYIVILIFAFSTGIFDGDFSQATNSSPFIILFLSISAAAFYIAFLYFSFVFAIRRLHDRNQTGWLSLLMLIPLINFIFMIYLICAKGTDGENTYGPSRNTAGWEKVLGWIYIILIPLLLVFSLTIIAIPAYQDYIERSQQTQMQYQQYDAE